MRKFASGATRSSDEGKIDYEGFLSPLALRRFGEYMQKHQVCEDGSLRASDNWQKGIPVDSYFKSLWRHFIDAWSAHRGWPHNESLEDALCAVVFNAQGALHEVIKARLGTRIVRPAGQCTCAWCERRRMIEHR